MHALVSIVIPAYNARRWIGESIESALAQTWPAKEIIVVDDGSRDGTHEIAQRYVSRGVRVLNQENRGASAARNAGLRLARGSYIQFLDADDLLHPQKIAHQMHDAERGETSRTLRTAAWGRFFGRTENASFCPDALWQDHAPVEWLLAKFNENKFMFPASWLVSRHLIETAGPWNESLSFDDDGEYMCRLVTASRHVRFVPDARCYYRSGNSSSLSSQKSARALQSSFASLRLCIRHLLQLEDSARTRAACLRLLQDNLPHFHPETPELANGCHELARSLGGELQAPQERLRFRLFRRAFGWKAARRMRCALNQGKLSALRIADRFLDIRPRRG